MHGRPKLRGVASTLTHWEPPRRNRNRTLNRIQKIECEVTIDGVIESHGGRRAFTGPKRLLEQVIKTFIAARHLELVRWLNAKRESVAREVADGYRGWKSKLEPCNSSENEES